MTKWKEFFDKKIKEIAKEKIVFDIGGCSKFQKSLASYKEYFLNCEYRTVDVNPDCHPDILADAQNLPIPDNSADGVKYLFKKFGKIEICPMKRHFETIACLLPYQNKFPINILVYLARLLDVISERYQSKKQVSGYSVFLVK